MNHQSKIVQQFGNPSGILGSFIGWLMSIKNRKRIQWAVQLMDVQPDDEILEIGFGPGVAIELMNEKIASGSVCGMDRSALMVKKASQRNKQGIQQHKIELLHGDSVKQLDNKRQFNKVLAINVTMFWKKPAKELRSIKRLLQPNGFFLIVLQPHWAKTEEEVLRVADRIVHQMQKAKFQSIELQLKKIKELSCIAVKGFAPGDPFLS